MEEKIEKMFEQKIKGYEECIDKLKELDCPEYVLMQVISVYKGVCNDRYSVRKVIRNN